MSARSRSSSEKPSIIAWPVSMRWAHRTDAGIGGHHRGVRYGLGITLTVLSIPIGCGSSTGPTSVDLVFTALTVGEELDPDGHTI